MNTSLPQSTETEARPVCPACHLPMWLDRTGPHENPAIRMMYFKCQVCGGMADIATDKWTGAPVTL